MTVSSCPTSKSLHQEANLISFLSSKQFFTNTKTHDCCVCCSWKTGVHRHIQKRSRRYQFWKIWNLLHVQTIFYLPFNTAGTLLIKMEQNQVKITNIYLPSFLLCLNEFVEVFNFFLIIRRELLTESGPYPNGRVFTSHKSETQNLQNSFCGRLFWLSVGSVQFIHLDHLLSVYSSSLPGHFQVQAACFIVLWKLVSTVGIAWVLPAWVLPSNVSP